MKYMGSKRRIAKNILPIILRGRKPEQYYVEPFVGGANIMEHVTGNRIGADADKCLIEAMKLIRDRPRCLPTSLSEDEYRTARELRDKALKGYIGYALSYGGKWFGGYRRDSAKKRNYIMEAYRNAQKQSVKLQGVDFTCCSYDKLYIPPNSIVYCDPPYEGVTAYKSEFDHAKFWEWCREQSSLGHAVFASSYYAPWDFECVWSMEIASSLTQNTGAKVGVEKLFIYNKEK